MKHIILLTFFIALSFISFSQSWQWSVQIGGSQDDYVRKICNDLDGNIYIAGTFYSNECYFNTDTIQNIGYNNFFIAKYTNQSDLVWIRNLGSFNPNTIDEGIGSLIYDSTSNTILCNGLFFGNCTFGTITLQSNGSGDGFIAKYDTAGTCLWGNKRRRAWKRWSNGIGCG